MLPTSAAAAAAASQPYPLTAWQARPASATSPAHLAEEIGCQAILCVIGQLHSLCKRRVEGAALQCEELGWGNTAEWRAHDTSSPALSQAAARHVAAVARRVKALLLRSWPTAWPAPGRRAPAAGAHLKSLTVLAAKIEHRRHRAKHLFSEHPHVGGGACADRERQRGSEKRQPRHWQDERMWIDMRGRPCRWEQCFNSTSAAPPASERRF